MAKNIGWLNKLGDGEIEEGDENDGMFQIDNE